MTFATYRDTLTTARDIDDPRLLMASHGPLEVRYAPFDYVNPHAKLVILGITPGRVQADEAIRTAGSALRRGLSDGDAMRLAKSAASFAGPMRRHLVDMLDDIGVARALGIASCASLWTQDARLVQFASALRYPVFKAGENYTGGNPGMGTSPFLLAQVAEHTGAELANIPNALVVPLGRAADACDWLVKTGRLKPSRLLRGVPHPSGANGERIAFFLGRKSADKLSKKTNPEVITAGRLAALQSVEAWRATL